MSHFIFVRYFYQYGRHFPFDGFAHLQDDGLVAALKAFYAEQRRADPKYSVKAHNAFDLMRKIEADDEFSVYPPDMTRGTLIGTISHRFPLGTRSSKESAVAVSVALQATVAELVHLIELKSPWNRQDYFLVMANPRFFAAPEDSLSREEALLARAKILRLNGPPGQYQTTEEEASRLLHPLIWEVLHQPEPDNGLICEGPDWDPEIEKASSDECAGTSCNHTNEQTAYATEGVSRNAVRGRHPSKITLATAILMENPDLTNLEVASRVPCNVKYLSQSSDFKKVRNTIKVMGSLKLRHSKKSRGSDMDEYANEDS